MITVRDIRAKHEKVAERIVPDALASNEKEHQLLHEELFAAYEELTASEESLQQKFDELLAKEGEIYRQNTVLNLLHDTAIGLIADLDHDAVLKKIICRVRELFNTPDSFVYLVNEETSTYTLKIGKGIFNKLDRTGTVTEGIFGQAYRTGEIAIVGDYSGWQYRLPDSIFDQLHYAVLVPLKNKDKMIGAIGLAFSERGRILAEDELFLLQRFADLASLALSNALLVDSLHNEIKERKQAEKELRQSEEKFSKAFYLSPDIITISRLDGTYVDVNEGFVRISGFSREEAIGKSALDLGIWQDQRARNRMIEMQKEYGDIRNLEIPFRCKDGNIAYGQLAGCIIQINGESFYMTVVRDITARVEAEKVRQQQEEVLLASRNKLSLAAGLANLGPWEYNPETELYEFDDEFYAIYSTDVARDGRFMSVDTYIREFVHPEDAWMFKKEKSFLWSEEQLNASDMRHRIIRRDGEVRTVLVRRSAIRNAEGKIIKRYGTNQDITERVQVEEAQRKQAETINRMVYVDSLTGLANRYHLNEWLNKELEHARLGQATGVILFIDLDDLKMVNDTYGHSFGDKIIIAAGERIVAGLSEKAFVARIGGDEFVVILPGTYEREQIEEIASKVSLSLGEEQEFFGRRFHMTASIGIVSYPADGDTLDEIIKNADNAMYAAKKDNKACWRFYNEDMQKEAYKKIQLTGSLRYALARGELSLVYQPQISTTEKNVFGFETLLRWNSAEYGFVSPMQFIPLAEQSGIIHSIGRWVLREACQFARRLADQGWNEVRVAVNISSKQIAADDFIEMICSAVQEAGIEPHQLELEITESVLMTSMEEATRKLTELKTFGVHLSLDDFGTGFSSLTYLRRLPVETIKIDKSFIDMIIGDAQDAKIIGSIINMAHTIDMNVVAEGVETDEQLEYLADKGCDLIQGYLFSRPVPETEAFKLLPDKIC